jgi:GNAT superfamily N-acetyltransferase
VTDNPAVSGEVVSGLIIRTLIDSDIEGPAGLDNLRKRLREELRNERGGPLFLAEEFRSSHELVKGSGRDLQDPNRRGHKRDDGLSVGAFVDDALVGWAYLEIDELPNDKHPNDELPNDKRPNGARGALVGKIRELAVDPQARGIGVGEELLNFVLTYCRSRGCIGADSFALPGARETKNFFETFGMKARLLTVHVSFGDDPGSETPVTPSGND